MNEEDLTKNFNNLCKDAPYDMSLKIESISLSLKKLKSAYDSVEDPDSIPKINERIFHAFHDHFVEIEDNYYLIQKLEAIRVSLEPEAYEEHFISLYKKAYKGKSDNLADNQSSSEAIVNYLAAQYGMNEVEFVDFWTRLKNLQTFVDHAVFVLHTFLIISLNFFVLASTLAIGYFFEYLEKRFGLPAWAFWTFIPILSLGPFIFIFLNANNADQTQKKWRFLAESKTRVFYKKYYKRRYLKQDL